jgi:hypothetical protein
MIVLKLKIMYEHQQNLTMKLIVQQMVVDGYCYIPIWKKHHVSKDTKKYFILHVLFS